MKEKRFINEISEEDLGPEIIRFLKEPTYEERRKYLKDITKSIYNHIYGLLLNYSKEYKKEDEDTRNYLKSITLHLISKAANIIKHSTREDLINNIFAFERYLYNILSILFPGKDVERLKMVIENECFYYSMIAEESEKIKKEEAKERKEEAIEWAERLKRIKEEAEESEKIKKEEKESEGEEIKESENLNKENEIKKNRGKL